MGSKQMGKADHSAIDIEVAGPYSELATSVKSELDALFPFCDECIIHRVQENLRELDEKAYTPRVVSIGPIHHGKRELKAMEEYKRRYLNTFLGRTEVRLDDFIEVIKIKESKVRQCYAEFIALNSDDFVKMILMDAAFIFEIILTHIIGKHAVFDRVYGSPTKIYDIVDDLYMLENQLPFFILQDLFKFANIEVSSERLSFSKIAHKFSKYQWDYLGVEENFDESKYSKVKHLVDFLRISIVPSKSQAEKRPEILTTPNVVELNQAGVKFKPGSSRNLFDITFRNGVLEIPRITIRGRLEYILKNLLVFEQSQCDHHLINDYVIFMNYLVNTPKDVKLLVQHEIIHNPIGDSERVSTLFHNLVERPTFRPDYFHFSNLVEDLNVYCRRPWHKWKTILKQDYFKTPWTTVSVVAAVILLVLTFIQTVCSIIQVK